LKTLQKIENYFQLRANKTTFAQEIRAGFATFLTMAYILFVNPSILSKAIELSPQANSFGQIMSATALAAALGTLVMGLYARYPFATAPGMGLNAFFTYTLVIHQKIPWQIALGCVFLSGLIAVVISAFGLRENIIRAFPLTLKRATAAGIGLFLAFIGFVNSGLIVDHPATLVTLGSFRNPSVALTCLGLLTTGVLLALRVTGALLIGISVSTIAAMTLQLPVYQGHTFGGFSIGVFQPPVWPTDLFFALDIRGAFTLSLFTTILSMFFVDFFDTAGTLVGLADRAGFTDRNGNLPRGSKAFIADGLASTFGALIGTSSTTSYIESMAGIEEGGRTGLVSVVVAALFLASLFLWPLASAVPAAATAPALIMVGSMMLGSAFSIPWDDPLESIPAFLTIITMPLTYSISNGIAFGIVAYTLLNGISGNFKKLHPVMYILTGLLMAKFGLE
jgi:AGZA family xanthine/uracil permease-like MFS transporter